MMEFKIQPKNPNNVFYSVKTLFIFVLAFVALGFIFVPKPAKAVDFPNTVNITFDPAQPAIGTQVRATLTLTVNPVADPFSADLSVCAANGSCNARIAQTTGASGKVATLDFTVDPSLFKVGDNLVQGSFLYQIGAGSIGGATPYIYTGQARITVKPATATTPTLTISEVGSSYAGANKVVKSLSITYLDGGTGKAAASYNYDCGGGTKSASIDNDPKKFDCAYPLQAASYTVKADALDSGGVKLASGSLTVNITGKEDQGGVGASTISKRLDFGGLLLSIVNIILGVIISLLRWLIYALANIVFLPLLEKTLTFTAGGIAGGAILIGWTYVRDIVNMLFILVLIAIGLGTILRIESYNYKKLLVNVIMMALLVNFSLLIGQIIIQLADVVQFTFLPADQGINGVRGLYEKLFTVNTFGIVAQGITFDTPAALNATFTMIFQFVLELGVIITFGALAIFMLIRTVALWILLIISPIAYALAVLPATAGLAKKWWTNFIKYAFFAPLIAFFLRLSFTIYEHALQFGSFSGQATADAGTTALLSKAASSGGGFTQSLELSMVYVVIIAFLWAGLIMTRQMGIFGANAIVGLAEKGMKLPLAGAWAGTKALGGLIGRTYSGWVGKKIGDASKKGEAAAREAQQAKRKLAKAKTPEQKAKYQEQLEDAQKRQKAAARASAGWRVMSLLNPKVVAEAWKKRREEKELRAYGPAIGHMQDTFNRIIPTEWLKPSRLKQGEFGKKTYHGLVGERAVVSKEAEELLKGVRTREDAAQIMINALKSGDKDEIMAAAKVLQHGNWQDDYMNIIGKKFSSIRYLNDITGKMKAQGFSEGELTTFLDDLKETAEQQGRARAYGYTTMDPDGVVRAANDLSYYAKLSSDELSKALQDVGEKFKMAAEETGEEDFRLASDMFLRSAGRAAKGENFEEIAKSENYGSNDNQTFDFAMTERRFMNEANVKFRRGNAGLHARAMEAALFVDQDPETGWDEKQNLMGKMLIHELPPNIASSITGRIHESQARLVEGFGGFRDESNGKWSLPDLDIAYKTDAQIKLDSQGDVNKEGFMKGQRDKHRVNLDKVIASRMLNQKFFDAITSSDRLFTQDLRIKFAKDFNKLMDSTSTSTNPEVQKLINEISTVAKTHSWGTLDEKPKT